MAAFLQPPPKRGGRRMVAGSLLKWPGSSSALRPGVWLVVLSAAAGARGIQVVPLGGAGGPARPVPGSAAEPGAEPEAHSSAPAVPVSTPWEPPVEALARAYLNAGCGKFLRGGVRSSEECRQAVLGMGTPGFGQPLTHFAYR
ncbi:hypothetical protein T492DRAFT_888546 [Pavlovales sp. CCMP2436]|nr:hypothetical protein T492DRAFT_888546 [Pavlovales sp. CCMP2436]